MVKAAPFTHAKHTPQALFRGAVILTASAPSMEIFLPPLHFMFGIDIQRRLISLFQRPFCPCLNYISQMWICYVG